MTNCRVVLLQVRASVSTGRWRGFFCILAVQPLPLSWHENITEKLRCKSVLLRTVQLIRANELPRCR